MDNGKGIHHFVAIPCHQRTTLTLVVAMDQVLVKVLALRIVGQYLIEIVIVVVCVVVEMLLSLVVHV